MKVRFCSPTAKYLPLLAVSALSLAAADWPAGADAPHDGSLQDSNIRTVGRWDKSGAATFHSYWSGAYLRVGFSGASIGLRLAQGAPIS